MFLKRFSLLTLAALAAFNLKAAPLSIGDPPPALKVSQWVKGDAVTSLDTNNTYVVEFWATWCGPCKASIPHLTEMAHKFTKVTFIGVDVWENDENKAATVATFVKSMGDKMDYHVAMDTDDKFMADNWMKAAEQNGIPTAFLIQQGEIIWIGHPMELEAPLTEATSGHFDIEKAKKRADAVNKVRAFYQKAMKGGDEAELRQEGKELEALDKELGGITPGQTFNTEQVLEDAKFNPAMQAYEEAVIGGSNDVQIASLKTAAQAAAPKDVDFDRANQQLLADAVRIKETRQVQVIFKQYIKATGENGDQDKANDLGKQLQDLNIQNPQLLNELAWAILTDEKIKQRDLVLAIALTKAGVDKSDGKEAAMLDTYARALFDSGKFSDAVENQKKAVAVCDDATMKTDLQATLDKYQTATVSTK